MNHLNSLPPCTLSLFHINIHPLPPSSRRKGAAAPLEDPPVCAKSPCLSSSILSCTPNAHFWSTGLCARPSALLFGLPSWRSSPRCLAHAPQDAFQMQFMSHRCVSAASQMCPRCLLNGMRYNPDLLCAPDPSPHAPRCIPELWWAVGWKLVGGGVSGWHAKCSLLVHGPLCAPLRSAFRAATRNQSFWCTILNSFAAHQALQNVGNFRFGRDCFL